MNKLSSLRISKKYLFPTWKLNVIGECRHEKFKFP